MKEQKKNSKGPYVQVRNKRWKWMAGAAAATAAGVTASQANTITINLSDNILGFYGNNLNADLTGDGHPDLTIANAFFRTSFSGTAYTGKVSLNGVLASFRKRATVGGLRATERLGSEVTYYYKPLRGTTHTYGNPSLTGSIPIFFKDLHINGGAPTEGFLEVTAFFNEIQLDSFTYDTPVQGSSRAVPVQGSSRAVPVQGSSRAVPDQGSSLALLAMGAGGILAFRRWRATQERS